ncbi:hypothetical protein [Caballeronia grimmiae]|nr:hypothetical protein [Caballeronia grimmiae]
MVFLATRAQPDELRREVPQVSLELMRAQFRDPVFDAFTRGIVDNYGS